MRPPPKPGWQLLAMWSTWSTEIMRPWPEIITVQKCSPVYPIFSLILVKLLEYLMKFFVSFCFEKVSFDDLFLLIRFVYN